ncbi:MAG: PIN domain-containing protein [Peptococcaceae bacterium]|jgi:predicted nucleic acid-binding protein|nr:PIN domain-containing protein [Peptococcaceae bacterium]
MKAIIGTNVIIDVTDRRAEFFADSYRTIQLSMQKAFNGYITAGAVSDIYYITRKSTGDAKKAREAIAGLIELVSVCDTRAGDIPAALVIDMPDLEDAIVAATAKREKADFIVTRNVRDYRNSPIPAVTPQDFLNKLDGGI